MFAQIKFRARLMIAQNFHAQNNNILKRGKANSKYKLLNRTVLFP